jgi:carboxyl-terminal processing protease
VATDPAKDTQLTAALDLLRGKAITKTEPATSEPPKAETKEN